MQNKLIKYVFLKIQVALKIYVIGTHKYSFNYPSRFVGNTGIQEETPAVPQLKKQKQRPSRSLFPSLYSTLVCGLNNNNNNNNRHKTQISVEVNSSLVISWNKTAMDLFIYFKLRKLLLTPETFNSCFCMCGN